MVQPHEKIEVADDSGDDLSDVDEATGAQPSDGDDDLVSFRL